MEEILHIDNLFDALDSKDDKVRYPAFQELLKITEQQVTWIYDKWFLLTDKLSSDNSFQRSIGLMLLANLCKSDTEHRFLELLDRYLDFFEDEKFITSRQCIQNVWKIAIVHPLYQKKIVEELESSFFDNKNPHVNLIKQDIISSLHQIYLNTNNEEIKLKINELIESENDAKLVKSLKKLVV